MKYKVGQTFLNEKFSFIGKAAKPGDRYYELVYWFGLSFLPIKQFVILELQDCTYEWLVIKISK